QKTEGEIEIMIIMPLGVASATPTATRHLPSVALWREGRTFLFDCGENTQMRMLQAGMKRSKIEYIFISHMDGDHIFGLLGLLSTFQLQRRDKKLVIVGPERIKEFVDTNMKLAGLDLVFELEYILIEEGFDHKVVVDDESYFVEARPLQHTSFCVGYRFQEKDKPGKVDAKKASELGIRNDGQFKELKAGRDVKLSDGTIVKSDDIVGKPQIGESFAYVTDTVFCENAIQLADKVTILYHEATFSHNLKEKAEETGHSSAQDAAIVAKTANAEKLVLSHFSARYTNQFALLKEAKAVFSESWLANELRQIMTRPKQEKGIFKPTVELVDANSKPAAPAPKKRIPSKGRSGTKKRFTKRTNSRYYKSDETGKPRHEKVRKNNPHKPNKPLPITPRTPFDDFDRF
ncbi:MAG: ribonuclease Z, partial [Balneolales bacterium]